MTAHSILSPKPPSPVSPQASLIHTAPIAVAQDKWLQMKFCVGPLKGSMWPHLSVSGREKSCHFTQLDVIWVLFGLWCHRLGSPDSGLDPTLLRVTSNTWNIPLAIQLSPLGVKTAFTHSLNYHSFNYHPWVSRQPSLCTPLPVMLWWSCISIFISLLSHYGSVFYSRWFLYNLVVIPDWSWNGVSVASTYSSAIVYLL